MIRYFRDGLDNFEPDVLPDHESTNLSVSFIEEFCLFASQTVESTDNTSFLKPKNHFDKTIYFETHIDFSFLLKNYFVDFLQFFKYHITSVFEARLKIHE